MDRRARAAGADSRRYVGRQYSVRRRTRGQPGHRVRRPGDLLRRRGDRARLLDPVLDLLRCLLRYGEIIGGGERATDLAFLEKQVADHEMPPEAFEWYFDLRRYGSVPHSGFGLGLERTVTWICGLDHLREAIPFPRLLGRLAP